MGLLLLLKMICILNISVLISNIINVDNYNPHENSLGISTVNKGVLKSKV